MKSLKSKITVNEKNDFKMARIWIQNDLFTSSNGFGGGVVYNRFIRDDSIILESCELSLPKGERVSKANKKKYLKYDNAQLCKVSDTERGDSTIDILAKPLSNFILNRLDTSIEELESLAKDSKEKKDKSIGIFVNCKATTSDNHQALRFIMERVA